MTTCSLVWKCSKTSKSLFLSSSMRHEGNISLFGPPSSSVNKSRLWGSITSSCGLIMHRLSLISMPLHRHALKWAFVETRRGKQFVPRMIGQFVFCTAVKMWHVISMFEGWIDEIFYLALYTHLTREHCRNIRTTSFSVFIATGCYSFFCRTPPYLQSVLMHSPNVLRSYTKARRRVLTGTLLLLNRISAVSWFREWDLRHKP
jgi:hypothetical protein